jgi:membrane protein implicated in regulation of membrane protease activity
MNKIKMDRFEITDKFRKAFNYAAIAIVIVLSILNISTSMFVWAYFGRVEFLSETASLIIYVFAFLVRAFLFFSISSVLLYFLLRFMKIIEERKIMELLSNTPEKITKEVITDAQIENGKKSDAKRHNKKREMS